MAGYQPRVEGTVENEPSTGQVPAWKKMIRLASSRWWLPPLILAISIVVLGWVVLQVLEHASPFVYVAF